LLTQIPSKIHAQTPRTSRFLNNIVHAKAGCSELPMVNPSPGDPGEKW